MTAHSAGPWHVSKTGAVVDASGRLVAVPFDPLLRTQSLQSSGTLANAALIAAAPDMLALLQRLMATHHRGAFYGVPSHEMESLIDRAKGDE